MSIWCSVGGPSAALQVIPDRDEDNATSGEYAGVVYPGTTYSIGVATTWHDGVRLIVDESRDGEIVNRARLMLSPDEVQSLIQLLAATAPINVV